MEELGYGWSVGEGDDRMGGSTGGEDGSGDVFAVEETGVGFVDRDDVAYKKRLTKRR